MSKKETAIPESIFIGQSSVAKQLRASISKISQTSKNLLIAGERGVGKYTLAQALHQSDGTKESIKVITPITIDESEIKLLTEKGSPSSLTLVIRDIEEFSFLHQVLLYKMFQSLSKQKNIRLGVTSKEKISELKKNRKVKDELVQLMDSFEQVTIPPLNNRRDDIPPLIEHFIVQACNTLNVNLKSLDINTMDVLARRIWRDNARELKDVIEHAVLNSKDDVVDIPASLLDAHSQVDGILLKIDDAKPFAFDQALGNLEKILIERILNRVGGNQTKSAEIIGISGPNFRYRLRKYRITRKGR
ncbi:MAG: sigma 54-interacting transcriptional regulator [Ignavibacteriales bacterium]|nr:sigma 54-interacting transcriptional regulator [Ignavibacteriales bacterium]